MPSKSMRPHLMENLKDPEFRQIYLNDALQETDPAAMMIALCDVAEALGISKAKIAREVGITQQGLIKIMKGGNPRWNNVAKIIQAVGYKWSVVEATDQVV